MSRARLSALDASFLDVESGPAHMHVGWAAVLSPLPGRARPSFDDLRAHIESRLGRAPRYRQRLAEVPFGLHDPVWVDDRDFDPSHHIRASDQSDLAALSAEVLSRRLRRDRPLWELWITDRLSEGRIGVVGKVHHCMVDGLAAWELASLLFDPSPDSPASSSGQWLAAPPPDPVAMGATAVRERISDGVRLAGRALKLSRPSTDLLALPAGALQATRTLAHMVFPIGTSTALNCSLTSDRRLVTARRPFADLLTIKRHHRATVNDVVLATCAGALHRLLKDSGEESRRLKAMVPVSARDPHQRAELGNQVSALFLGLPSDETDPVERLRHIQRSMGARKRARDDQAARVAAEALRYVPRSLRRLAAPQLVAKAQGFNLTISNIPGPRQPLYMLGCRLDEAYPVVPLPENHALSIGMTAIDQTACFGTYVDPVALPEADRFADCLHTALDELLDTTNHRSRPSASARSSRPHPVRAD